LALVFLFVLFVLQTLYLGLCTSKKNCQNIFCDKIHPNNILVCVDFNHCDKAEACPDRHPMRVCLLKIHLQRNSIHLL
jgi:hypothetical protein